ncbi:MAG: helix-turn-helix transcriptional regulator [Sedimentisphaerales bacterium]|nr:helix-turn-helix transcriptional regulator [Sedimentisphaerales bacterium]
MYETLNQPIENSIDSGSGKNYDVVLLNKEEWSYVKKRYNLTPREYQIAELICQGLHNGKIANFLRISPGTVNTHIRNIYRKTHVTSKMAMLLRFVTDARATF